MDGFLCCCLMGCLSSKNTDYYGWPVELIDNGLRPLLCRRLRDWLWLMCDGIMGKWRCANSVGVITLTCLALAIFRLRQTGLLWFWEDQSGVYTQQVSWASKNVKIFDNQPIVLFQTPITWFTRTSGQGGAGSHHRRERPKDMGGLVTPSEHSVRTHGARVWCHHHHTSLKLLLMWHTSPKEPGNVSSLDAS